LVQAAVQGTFQESIDGIADLTGLSVSKRSLEELLVDAARDFDVFYRNASRRQRSAVPVNRSSIPASGPPLRSSIQSGPLPTGTLDRFPPESWTASTGIRLLGPRAPRGADPLLHITVCNRLLYALTGTRRLDRSSK
jgi:hypothetical protein